MKKIIVCGGRNYTDTYAVFAALDSLHVDFGEPLFIIHGGATGADQRAGEWAEVRGMPCAVVKANWEFYAKSAGPRRNEWMMDLRPDLVVAFPGNAGTQNMVSLADRKGVPVKAIS